ncbi:large-conductance mechanosensitive channel protein MscL [Paenibacillus cymbidii]|uniref:large-conductance mechanosensitive channel protein MscL n=1 Tax=Paenibacillus cymbidii TaxID=1639034 RepID=UPI00107FF041|nr:large-conductance mechanosensitive channel protein MscL [Paenibacillus cymbidii]
MFKEFRTFITRGNVVDLAIGVIIGTAFNKIVTSLVNDVIMPPIGMLLGKVDFADLVIKLGNGEDDKPVTLNYGAFINNVLDFLIVAFVIFMVVKQINRFRKPEPAPAPAAPKDKECPYCYSKIPVLATRCPACTSQLQQAAGEK